MTKRTDLHCVYVSADNRSGEAGEPGWVDHLKNYITYVIKREYQLQVQFNLIEINADHSEGLPALDAIDPKAFILVVLSEAAVSDPLWRKILENVAEDRGRMRLITLLKEPIYSSELPSLLHDHPKFDFYLTDTKSGKTIEVETLFSSQYLNSFLLKVFDLVKLFGADDPDKKMANQRTVYLTLTSYDLAAARDTIRRALIQEGYKVLPEVAYPYDMEELENTIYEDLRQCDLALHLIGKNYDNGDYNTELSISEIQYQVALDYHRALLQEYDEYDRPDFTRILWVPEPDDKIDEKQSRFLANLYSVGNHLDGAKIVRGTVEEVKEIVFNQLSYNPSLMRGYKEVENKNERKSIYIMSRPQYNKTCKKIKSILKTHELDVVTSDASLNRDDFVEIHRQNLLSCDGVLFLAENRDLLWLRSKMNDVHKANNWGRNKPYLAVAVYSGSLEMLPDDSTFDQTMLLRKEGRFNAHLLDPFIAKTE